MKREVYKLFDVILKIIILTYLSDFLQYIGEKRRIIEVLKTEITTLNGRTRYLDFLCLLDDDTICHVEFQFPYAHTDDMPRFFDYNIVAQIRYDKLTETIVFNFEEENKGAKESPIGYSKDFHPKSFYLGDIDFEEELEKIHLKLNLGQLEKIISNDKTNIKLTHEEELHLLQMSLSPKYKNKKKLLKPVVGLLKNEKLFDEEKINIIKSIIKLEIDNLIPAEEQKEFKGALKMTNESEKIINQAISEVNKKYEQMALEKGKKEGREEVAKNLKGMLKPEEISKATGLSLKTIMLL